MGDLSSCKLLILGLDGLSWQLLDPLLEAGVMPNLARLRSEGAWGPLMSVIPTQSATAWASFITGQNPARHGVFDFMTRQTDGSYRHSKPDSATTLWSYLGAGGLKVGVVNFPVTYPPDRVNGFLVSGMLTPKGRAFTFPPSLGDDILTAVPDYQLDLEWELYRGRDRELLHDLQAMTVAQVRATRLLCDRYTPDFLAVAFIGPDRLQHGMMRCLDPAYRLPSSEPRSRNAQAEHDAAECRDLMKLIRSFYTTLDGAIGELVRALPDEATVIALSDHGFQRTVWQFRVEPWLAQHGWLTWIGNRSRFTQLVRRLDTPWVRHVRRRLLNDVSRHFPIFAPGGTVDWSRTAAFSAWIRQQGIRLNVRGREPQGIVAPGEEYEQLRDAIAQALLDTTEPTTGETVVDRVWRREELYEGSFYEETPDLLFTLKPDFTASPVQQSLWAPTGWASGDHSLLGMFLAWGRSVRPGRVAGAQLVDIAPTALHLLDQPLPPDMDGKVLVDALDPAFLDAHPVRRADRKPSLADLHEQEALSPEEEADLQARLRGLGYL